MIGVDTNVLLRLLLRDSEGQVRAALALVEAAEAGDKLLLNPIVLAEIAWTLTQRGRSRAEIAQVIEDLCERSEIVVPFGGAVVRALETYRSSRADYADCLIAETNAVLGAEQTYTFDRDAAATPHFSLVGD